MATVDDVCSLEGLSPSLRNVQVGKMTQHLSSAEEI